MSAGLGPGLTSQIGPFKTNRHDYPKVRKFPWKGIFSKNANAF